MTKTEKKEYYRLWYLKNKIKRSIYNKEHREKHKEYNRLYHLKYYAQFKDLILKKNRLLRIKNGWVPRVPLKGRKVCRCCKIPSIYLISAGNGYFICRECNTKRVRTYRETLRGRIAVNRAVRKSTRKYPERQKARSKVFNALLSGSLVKPQKCEKCNQGGFIYAHHHDYNKPLDVMWVCRNCHFDLHKDLDMIK